MESKDIERTTLGLQTDIPTDICKTICLLFQGGHTIVTTGLIKLSAHDEIYGFMELFISSQPPRYVLLERKRNL